MGLESELLFVEKYLQRSGIVMGVFLDNNNASIFDL